MDKAKNLKLNLEYLQKRADRLIGMGYPKPKWVSFCEFMISAGFLVYLYEAKKTRSKYITVSSGQSSYKIRISDHKPIKSRETSWDCDFFVGVTHTGVRTTEDAKTATLNFFGVPTCSSSDPTNKNAMTRLSGT